MMPLVGCNVLSYKDFICHCNPGVIALCYKPRADHLGKAGEYVESNNTIIASHYCISHGNSTNTCHNLKMDTLHVTQAVCGWNNPKYIVSSEADHTPRGRFH